MWRCWSLACVHTFPLHTHSQALLVAAILTAIALAFVDQALFDVSTLVGQVFSNGSFKEPFASFTTVYAVMLPCESKHTRHEPQNSFRFTFQAHMNVCVPYLKIGPRKWHRCVWRGIRDCRTGSCSCCPEESILEEAWCPLSCSYSTNSSETGENNTALVFGTNQAVCVLPAADIHTEHTKTSSTLTWPLHKELWECCWHNIPGVFYPLSFSLSGEFSTSTPHATFPAVLHLTCRWQDVYVPICVKAVYLQFRLLCC